MSRSSWLTRVSLMMIATVSVGVLAAPASAATAGAIPAGRASAASDSAEVVVEVAAKRNILPTSGWSDVEVFVRNDGSLPAAAVTVTLTLPPGLRTWSTESTSDWDCDWGTPVLTCTHIGDLAPGASKRAIRRSVGVEGAQAGAVLEVSATATTSTPEGSTTHNAASRPIRIVESGEIRSRLWNDLDADGIRQPGEPPVTDVGVSIDSLDDEDGYGVSNTYDGTYIESVPSKRYKIRTSLYRSNWRFTKPDVGADDTDSDLRVVSDSKYYQVGESPVFSVTAATPTVFDVGVVAAFRPKLISPTSGRRDTTAAVTLTGESFTPSVQVELTRSGSAPIPGVVSNIAADGTSMDVSFDLAQAATGAWTLVLDRQYGPHAEVADAFTVTLPQLRSVAAPSISGTAEVGSRVRAVVGTWSPKADSYRYEWRLNGKVIRGATGATLKLTSAMRDKKIAVTVIARKADYLDGRATSKAMKVRGHAG